MQGELIDPAHVGRFRRDLERLTGSAPGRDRRLLVAVSGGADSLALLLLAANAYPDAVVAATVDHGLRPTSRQEAEFVGGECRRLEIQHEVLDPSRTFDFRNLQEAARVARYGALAHWAGGWTPAGPRRAEWVATAHQADDVAESFLARAARASGVGGLAEMSRHREMTPVTLVRPLLDWSRAELAEIVFVAGLRPVEDPSNKSPRFDRSRFRRLIAEAPDLSVRRLARTARNLRDAEDALEWYMLGQLKARFREDEQGDLWLDPGGLPREFRRRFLVRGIQGIREENGLFEDWERRGVDRLLRALDAGDPGALAGVLVRVRSEGWHFTLAPPRRTV